MSETRVFIDIIDLVKREVKGLANQEEIVWLKQPENTEWWIKGLQAAIDDLMLQFDDRDDTLDRIRQEIKADLSVEKDYIEAAKEFQVWRKKASRYRLGLEQRLLEVSLTNEEKSPIIDVLINAIETHKTESFSARTSTPSDVRLWSLIDKLDIN